MYEKVVFQIIGQRLNYLTIWEGIICYEPKGKVDLESVLPQNNLQID